MRRLQTDIVVIGGGATGTGVLRDLAMRGFRCILVERRDLAYGTTGRYHGLLHSGARYAVKDPQAAKECYEENLILRKIMPQCVEDTGGYFVLTPKDEPKYVPLFIAGCQAAGIPVVPVHISQMLKKEPWLNPQIEQCFYVPDASADSFLAAALNAESARQHGAQVLTYHEVVNLIASGPSQSTKSTVSGAICRDLVKDEEVRIDASLVVNASGAWAGKIAQTAGIELVMLPGKGTMFALSHRIVNTVINRCRLPSDGDAIVPIHTVAVVGTTDIKVVEPNNYSIEPWELQLLLDEAEQIIPNVKQLRILRAWAGIRPLVQEAIADKDRDISREYVLLDHAQRDGVEGVLTITSGKWTTYRKMAMVTADKVCEKLNVVRPCRTHLEELPRMATDGPKQHYLGTRLEKIEQSGTYGQLICECELATQQDVEQAIIQNNPKTLDDIRRSTRLGMGPCQGAYCAFRAAGILHTLKRPHVKETNVSLRDFLQERWKGNLPILWGQQLQQARLNELIYVNVLNATSLPGDLESKLAVEEYNYTGAEHTQTQAYSQAKPTDPPDSAQTPRKDVTIIGAGFAGLFAAWQATRRGLTVNLITKGWGSPYWSSGCIDIFGYQPTEYNTRIESPAEFLEKFIASNPLHPYGLATFSKLEDAVQSFIIFSCEAGYPYHGSLETNTLLPTALGTLRPTCLVPDTMVAGSSTLRSPMLIVGFTGYLDFYPALIADNLSAQGILARDIMLDIASLRQRKFITSMSLARLFDDPEFRQEVIDSLKPNLGTVSRIGFPAVLGLQHAAHVKQQLKAALGIPVFEIPGLPPSIPGIRLQNLLVREIERNGGSVYNGMEVVGVSSNGNSVNAIYSQSSHRKKAHQTNNYILATGGILGGGIITTQSGYAQEVVFNLPLDIPAQRDQWFNARFLACQGHPIHQNSIQVGEAFQPLNPSRQVIFDNLYAIGSTLGNCDPIRERSMEGIALATGYAVVDRLRKAS